MARRNYTAARLLCLMSVLVAAVAGGIATQGPVGTKEPLSSIITSPALPSSKTETSASPVTSPTPLRNDTEGHSEESNPSQSLDSTNSESSSAPSTYPSSRPAWPLTSHSSSDPSQATPSRENHSETFTTSSPLSVSVVMPSNESISTTSPVINSSSDSGPLETLSSVSIAFGNRSEIISVNEFSKLTDINATEAMLNQTGSTFSNYSLSTDMAVNENRSTVNNETDSVVLSLETNNNETEDVEYDAPSNHSSNSSDAQSRTYLQMVAVGEDNMTDGTHANLSIASGTQTQNTSTNFSTEPSNETRTEHVNDTVFEYVNETLAEISENMTVETLVVLANHSDYLPTSTNSLEPSATSLNSTDSNQEIDSQIEMSNQSDAQGVHTSSIASAITDTPQSYHELEPTHEANSTANDTVETRVVKDEVLLLGEGVVPSRRPSAQAQVTGTNVSEEPKPTVTGQDIPQGVVTNASIFVTDGTSVPNVSTAVPTEVTNVTTSLPEEPGLEYRVTGFIRILEGAKWNPKLADRRSSEFGILASRLKIQLDSLYREGYVGEHLKEIRIDGFSEGSVLVVYTLVFTTNSEQLSPQKLKQVISSGLKDGALGEYRLDVDYTSFKGPWSSGPEPGELGSNEPPIPQWAIAVIVVAAACLIFSLLFAAVTVYGRGQTGPNRSLYDKEGMLDSPCPEWERKMAAAYENMAADNISETEIPKRCSYREDPLCLPLERSNSITSHLSIRKGKLDS